MSLIIKPAIIRDPEAQSWDKLVDEIWKGNVIPVIGDKFVVEGTTITNELLNHLSHKYNVVSSPRNFSELYYDTSFKNRETLYEEVSSLISENQTEFKPTDILKDFLSIEQFPFVITTSVDYTVEETMKEIWKSRGRSVKTLIFNNNPEESKDIKSSRDIKEPTVYYMFGKADNMREHSFVLTEEDMLTFCQSWLSAGQHPELLSKVIAKKYLLFLGVSYPDWLIRFIWFSMRNNLRNSGMLVDDREMENSLRSFFQRVSISTQSTPHSVYKEIKSRLDKKKEEYEKIKFDSVAQNTDFFISYSRKNGEWVEPLYLELTKRGYKVWYDKNNIVCGADWEIALLNGIRSSKCFIALLSDDMANEVEKHHPYRTEWDFALAHKFSNRKIIKPIHIGNTDIYKGNPLQLPEEMMYINSIPWQSIDDVSSIVDSIVETI